MTILGYTIDDIRKAQAWRYRQTPEYKRRLVDRGVVSVIQTVKHWISIGRPT